MAPPSGRPSPSSPAGAPRSVSGPSRFTKRTSPSSASAASGSARAAPDRTPSTLQVGDVVQHLGTDYLVEGALTFSEDGRAARLYRLVDGGAERFLYAAAGESDPLLLDAVPGLTVEGAPETLLHA